MTKNSENRLFASQLRNISIKDKAYKISDGGGLFLEVLSTGVKSWRYQYRYGEAKRDKNNKLVRPQRTFTIGSLENISLSAARDKRNELRLMVKEGRDPMKEFRYQDKPEAGLFQVVAEEWFSEQILPLSSSHSSRVRGYLDRDILPPLGKLSMTEIQAPQIIPVIKRVRDRGAIDAAKRVKGFIQQVFDYGVVLGVVSRNPARDINVSHLLPKRVKQNYSTILEPVKIGELLRAIDGYSGNYAVRMALRLAPYVFLRPSELVKAEWSEFDISAGRWVVPAKRRKLPTHIKQANRSEDALIVPLSTQVVGWLLEIQEYTGEGRFVFPSPVSRSKHISPNALRVALRNLGYENDDISPHGFRAMARSTLERLGYSEKLLELQLGHKVGSEVERAYARHDGLEQRCVIMQEWANYLDNLKHGGDVVPFKRKQA